MGTYNCTYCRAPFTHYGRTQHEAICLENPDRKNVVVFPCSLPSCHGLLYESKWDYQEHMRSHDDERCVFRCRLGCLNTWFSNASTWADHNKRIHGSSFAAAVTEAEIDPTSSSAMVKVDGTFVERFDDIWKVEVPAVFGTLASAELRCPAEACGGRELESGTALALHVFDQHLSPHFHTEVEPEMMTSQKTATALALRRCPLPQCTRRPAFKTDKKFVAHLVDHITERTATLSTSAEGVGENTAGAVRDLSQKPDNEQEKAPASAARPTPSTREVTEEVTAPSKVASVSAAPELTAPTAAHQNSAAPMLAPVPVATPSTVIQPPAVTTVTPAIQRAAVVAAPPAPRPVPVAAATPLHPPAPVLASAVLPQTATQPRNPAAKSLSRPSACIATASPSKSAPAEAPLFTPAAVVSVAPPAQPNSQKPEQEAERLKAELARVRAAAEAATARRRAAEEQVRQAKEMASMRAEQRQAAVDEAGDRLAEVRLKNAFAQLKGANFKRVQEPAVSGRPNKLARLSPAPGTSLYSGGKKKPDTFRGLRCSAHTAAMHSRLSTAVDAHIIYRYEA